MPYQPMPVTEVNTRIMTPFELAAGASEIQGNQLTNRLNQRKITELDRQDQQQNALRSLYQQTGGDTSKMREGLIAQGMGDAIPEFDKQQRELEKEQRLQEKDQLESAITKTAFIAQKLAPFVGQPYSPEIDQRYQATKAEIEQQFGAKMHTLPDQYDPQVIQQGYQQGMTVAQQLAQQYKAFDMSMKTQELGLNQQKFQQDVSQKGFENQLNQQKFGYQQQNDAANRAQTQANQGWYQTVDPKTGLPIWTQKNREGAESYSPTGISNKPLPTGQAKQVIGVTNLNDAIDEYTKQLDNFSLSDLASPDKRAGMGTKYNNMMLQAKEAYNLGVLNGPDMEILQSVITDPRTFTGAITSNKALKSQATELKRIMGKVKASASASYSRGGQPGQQDNPVQQDDTPSDWSQEEEAAYQRAIGGQ